MPDPCEPPDRRAGTGGAGTRARKLGAARRERERETERDLCVDKMEATRMNASMKTAKGARLGLRPSVYRRAGRVAGRMQARRQVSQKHEARSVAASSNTGKVVNAAVAAAPPAVSEEVIDKCINAIRFLSIDGVEAANSGHPGLPMGCAPMSYVLWNEVMKHNPANTKWINRDRFILSAGHGSMLVYSLLHLTGYNLPIEELKNFRQWGSKCAGHPENFVTDGVEVTTGPLGAGICNAVGFAMMEKHLAARFNKPDCEIIDNYTYCIMGDGCNMEGMSNEACSLAGHWGLGKLIAFYDDNSISIDGHTDISFTEDVSARYEALGWHVLHVQNGNTDVDAIRKAIAEAKAVTDKPTLIKVTTIIGYGSPNKADSHDVHGAALGADEVQATRDNLKWDLPPFEIPSEVYSAMRDSCQEKGAAAEAEWNATMATYTSKYPEEAAEFKKFFMDGEQPANWADVLPTFTPEDSGVATRIHSQTMLNAVASVFPTFMGGSADLAPSNMTLMKAFGDFQKDTPAERNVRFGVREHGMGSIANGMALYGANIIPYCATFFIFTDYMRAAMRLAALSEIGTIFVMTHDSIGLGEDGPTHQPVEHLASFRAMPNIYTFRPADGNETAGAYKIAVESRKTPSIMVCSRQGLPNLEASSIDNVAKGAYVVHETNSSPDVIVIGTGSEVAIAMEGAKKVEAEGKSVRVISMPCWEIFEAQSDSYKESILPSSVTARVSIEAGSTFGWEKFVGAGGKSIGVDTFGASAPGPLLYEKFGITADAVAAACKEVM